MSVHAAAIVEPGVKLGRDVEVGPGCYVAAGAEVGDGCRLGPHVTLFGCVMLGAGCRVHAGAVLGDLPQDTGFEGGDSYVRIGPGCTLREGVTIHRGTKAGSATEIGARCMFMANAHAAHNVRTGDDVVVANGALLAGYVQVGSRVFISGNALVHQFVRIGDLAMLGGGCAISKDVPPFCTVRPLAANQILGLNLVGMKRAGMGDTDRTVVKKAFQTLYRSGLNVQDALVALREQAQEHALLAPMVALIESSQRGICRLSSGRGDAGDEG